MESACDVIDSDDSSFLPEEARDFVTSVNAPLVTDQHSKFLDSSPQMFEGLTRCQDFPGNSVFLDQQG